ncbi:deoxynucleotide monophosphate kinase family protein [Stutzerimonas sp. KH-1]|jgi:hypothetical protein
MKQLIIGLHGLARTGKDTAARYLAAHYALLSYAFAEPLKAAIMQMFNLTAEHIEGALKEEPLPGIGKSPRQLMQLLGTDWGRDMVHRELWLLLAEQNLNHMASLHQDPITGFILRDVRFENEADWVRSKGGVIVHIHRPEAQAVASHASESGIGVHDNDFVIHNDEDLPHLYKQLDRLMGVLIRRQSLRSAA